MGRSAAGMRWSYHGSAMHRKEAGGGGCGTEVHPHGSGHYPPLRERVSGVVPLHDHLFPVDLHRIEPVPLQVPHQEDLRTHTRQALRCLSRSIVRQPRSVERARHSTVRALSQTGNSGVAVGRDYAEARRMPRTLPNPPFASTFRNSKFVTDTFGAGSAPFPTAPAPSAPLLRLQSMASDSARCELSPGSTVLSFRPVNSPAQYPVRYDCLGCLAVSAYYGTFGARGLSYHLPNFGLRRALASRVTEARMLTRLS
jgi:hypothetical protein